MWLANVVFTVVGIYFLHRVRTSGSTARGGDFSEMLDAARTAVGNVIRQLRIPVGRRRELPS
jgi:hypothetical protein